MRALDHCRAAVPAARCAGSSAVRCGASQALRNHALDQKPWCKLMRTNEYGRLRPNGEVQLGLQYHAALATPHHTTPHRTTAPHRTAPHRTAPH